MKNQRRTFIQTLAGAALAPLPWVSLRAQTTYPAKPVTIVVASTPGGQADLIARYLADEMSRALGKPFLIDNKAGASGIAGLQYAAQRPADGYTLAYGTGSWMAINPGFFPNLPYDPIKDFTPITQIGITPQCLMLGAHVPAKTLAEFIALAKAAPGKYTFASFGSGSSSHLQGEMLKGLAGIDMLHVPFKGSAQALMEVVAGRVDLFIIDFAPAVSFIKEGRIRALAVTGNDRVAEFPDVATFKELGYPLTLVGWNGLFTGAGTPPAIVNLLTEQFNKIIQSPAGKAKLRQLGAVPTGTTSEAYRRILVEDIAKWRELVQKSGAKPD
jgi:tripartite-type tricarboxylate transporter receptor subunit TctC